MSGLLENKTAIIYGAGGAIGAGVARAFAREGARVFLAGRTRESLDIVAAEIKGEGAAAEVAVGDAPPAKAGDEPVRRGAAKGGSANVPFHPHTRGDVRRSP